MNEDLPPKLSYVEHTWNDVREGYFNYINILKRVITDNSRRNINGTLYRHNPHSHYALYQSKSGEWRESASVTNEMLNLNDEEE